MDALLFLDSEGPRSWRFQARLTGAERAIPLMEPRGLPGLQQDKPPERPTAGGSKPPTAEGPAGRVLREVRCTGIKVGSGKHA